MRTTLNLDEHLLAQAKQVAAATGRTLAQVVEDALRAALAARKITRAAPIRLKTVKGTGTLPGVDLDSAASLLDHMEGR
jgi:hypothetical protein